MSTKDNLYIVNSLKVASPCDADWNFMSGDERARFCLDCKKNVYNVSGLTSDEVVQLIREHEEAGDHPPCFRLKRRADGTVVTGDCPVGLQRVRQKMAMVASLVIGIFGCSVIGNWLEKKNAHHAVSPRHLLGSIAAPSHLSGPPKTHVMGKIAPRHIEMGEVVAHSSEASL